MRLFLTGMATLALAACGSPDETNMIAADNAANAVETADNAANAANAIDHVAAIDNLSEAEQMGVFLRAIRDANLPCRDVVAAEKLEPQGGVATWRAECGQGEAHLILVQPDGSAQVMSRTN